MTTATITPTTIIPTTTGLTTAELEAELASPLPEREEMSSAFRFIHHHHHDYGCQQQYEYVRVWDPCRHCYVLERVVLVTSTVHPGSY
jgi:hypothetical protein